MVGTMLGGATCEVTDIGWPGEHWPGGIGAVLGHSSAEHRLVVREVPADSPAARAGLQVEDEVLEIDGHEVSGMELSEVVEALRGEVGSTVTLRLRRGEEELELEIERGPYHED
ncbi:MAG: PDZ domain-containing protein [Deltaproteobacteria bacterium]|nr:PDZ domain-containing protein [Deltaproteobacteria bacterium]